MVSFPLPCCIDGNNDNVTLYEFRKMSLSWRGPGFEYKGSFRFFGSEADFMQFAHEILEDTFLESLWGLRNFPGD